MTDLETVEDAVYGELYPHIEEIEDRLDASLSLFLAMNMIRRLATAEFPLEEILQEAKAVYAHQLTHNATGESTPPAETIH